MPWVTIARQPNYEEIQTDHMKLRNALSVTTLLLSGAALTSAAQAQAPEGFATLNGGVTGGTGGLEVTVSTGTQLHTALCTRASSDTPITIYVDGTINHSNTSGVSGDSCNAGAADDVIELKDVSNISIVGVGSSALFDELGIHIRNSSNIILQNLHIRNVKKSGSPTSNGGDAIGMESNVSNIWVDHCTLEASGGESDGHDALFDMKNNTKYVTLSYSHLMNSGRGGLVGSSDSDDQNNYVTYHHNYYENIDSRTPLLRFATAHSYNNYFNGLNSSGMNPRAGGQIRAENNHFQDAQNPIGTFYTELMGYWDVSGNIFEDVTWSSESSTVHPAGPNPTSTTSISIPYAYALDDANCVRDVVLSTAGAGLGMAVSDGSCTVTEPDTEEPDTEEPGTEEPDTEEPDDTDTGADGSGELGVNLALEAGSDGSSKASGSSYGNVRDGDLASYWQPSGSSGERISIKWSSETTFNTVLIREDGDVVTAYRLVDNETGADLASGTNLGTARVITLAAPVSSTKVNLVIDSASAPVRIQEFEVYNAQ